jgi:hypothetical protein
MEHSLLRGCAIARIVRLWRRQIKQSLAVGASTATILEAARMQYKFEPVLDALLNSSRVGP